MAAFDALCICISHDSWENPHGTQKVFGWSKKGVSRIVKPRWSPYDFPIPWRIRLVLVGKCEHDWRILMGSMEHHFFSSTVRIRHGYCKCSTLGRCSPISNRQPHRLICFDPARDALHVWYVWYAAFRCGFQASKSNMNSSLSSDSWYPRILVTPSNHRKPAWPCTDVSSYISLVQGRTLHDIPLNKSYYPLVN